MQIDDTVAVEGIKVEVGQVWNQACQGVDNVVDEVGITGSGEAGDEGGHSPCVRGFSEPGGPAGRDGCGQGLRDEPILQIGPVNAAMIGGAASRQNFIEYAGLGDVFHAVEVEVEHRRVAANEREHTVDGGHGVGIAGVEPDAEAEVVAAGRNITEVLRVHGRHSERAAREEQQEASSVFRQHGNLLSLGSCFARNWY